MSTPVKTTILAAVGTALTGIKVISGYKSTVVTVTSTYRVVSDVGSAERPWVFYQPRRERYSSLPYGIYRVTLPLYIGAHVQASTKALADAAMVNLQDDVIKALCADMTLGGNCIDLRLVDGDDDIGDPDTGMGGGETGYSGTFDQNWEITYERAMAGS